MTIDLTQLIAAPRRRFAQFLRDRSGISSIEFSLLLPVMALLFFGGVELTSGLAIDRKVSLVTRTLGDLVSQETNSQGAATVSWSDTMNGTARAVGSTVTLPSGLNVASTSLILAEAQYAYTPAVGYVVTGTVNLADQIYLRPRMASCVLRQGVQTTC